MDKIYGIFLTLIAGLFFLIGGLISFKVHNKDKFNHFSVGMAFVIMIGLICLDLIPEVRELFHDYSWGYSLTMAIIFALVGFLILKFLDILVPHHHHEHKDNEKNKKEHIEHIHHVGLITILSLILHNILEGFAIFGMTVNDFRVGLLIALSVGLHNIPLGIHIFSALDIRENKISALCLTFSSLVGGLVFLVIRNINNLVIGIITSITLGMLIYIAFLELLPEIRNGIKNEETKIGLGIGLIILLVSLFV